MNTMNMPGFTAEASLYKTSGRYQSEATRSFGSERKDNQVYMQLPNNQNTPGGKCHATTRDGSINSGTYDSSGNCCGPQLGNGSQFCINCDNANNTCGDGVLPFILPPQFLLFRAFTSGLLF